MAEKTPNITKKVAEPKKVALNKKVASELVVFAIGGKQYAVQTGTELLIEKILLKEGEKQTVKDLLTNKDVQLTVKNNERGPKIRIIKFKNKTRYMRRQGHRQNYTRVIVGA